MYNVGIIGLGFVGNSIYEFFKQYNNVKGYDLDINKTKNTRDDVLTSDILYLCLPTIFNSDLNTYDTTIIYNTCKLLKDLNYKGIILLKSTVVPKTTEKLSNDFNLKIIHNPEFLTARTACDDFKNQNHIVLGKTNNCDDCDLDYIYNFYKYYYPNAEISKCNSNESESMKIFCNNFYSVKIQFFNELYLLCQKMNCDFNIIKNLMLKNNWINPMHTDVPGPDGLLSYGGLCFPKDTNALLQFMKDNNSECSILEATINERNIFRTDNLNCK